MRLGNAALAAFGRVVGVHLLGLPFRCVREGPGRPKGQAMTCKKCGSEMRLWLLRPAFRSFACQSCEFVAIVREDSQQPKCPEAPEARPRRVGRCGLGSGSVHKPQPVPPVRRPGASAPPCE